MSRSLKKGPYVDQKLEKKVDKLLESGQKVIIKTWSRATMIIPKFLGFTFSVHTGNKFIAVLITEDMIGHRLGEFAPTRFFRGHAGSDKKAARR
ncbi:MAG: 30S ribosomal protein S19 [Cyanobacteria bacterium P01_H01_bin.74]